MLVRINSMHKLGKSNHSGFPDETLPQFVRLWIRRTLAIAIILVLAASVAHRYTSTPNLNLHPAGITASAHHGAKAQQQRMDEDSFVWSASLTAGNVVNLPTYYPAYAPAASSNPKQIFHSELYNRPPPIVPRS